MCQNQGFSFITDSIKKEAVSSGHHNARLSILSREEDRSMRLLDVKTVGWIMDLRKEVVLDWMRDHATDLD